MKKNNLVVILVFVTICMFIILILVLFTNNAQKKQSKKIDNRKWIIAQRKDIYEKISLRGIVASEEKQIFSATMAKVKSVYKKDGDFVKKGELIALLDDQKIKAEIKKKEKEKLRLQEELKDLYEKQRKSQVVSQVEGEVKEIYVNKGDFVTKGTPICKVERLYEKELTVSFPSWLYKDILLDDKVKVITLDTGDEMQGVVKSKSSSFYIDNGNICVFDVTVAVKSAKLPLKAKAYCIYQLGDKSIQSINEGVVSAEEETIKATSDGCVEELNIAKYMRLNIG